jgi:hypothetical protein
MTRRRSKRSATDALRQFPEAPAVESHMTTPLTLRLPVAYRVARLPPSAVREGSSAPGRLRDAIRPSILRALTAERADAYVAILAEMLALRRTGALAPTLDELRRHLPGGIPDEPAFLRDLLQLEEWGCLTRELEPLSIRGYRDARRERFRHRLTEDMVALLEWLEARVARGAAPLRVDANDRLRDVLDRVRELVRLTDGEAGSTGVGSSDVGSIGVGSIDAESGRRAVHLLGAIDLELDAIGRGLVSLHAEMRRFAGRTFERRALERILRGLEEYVAGFLRNVTERRRALGEGIARLMAPEGRERLSELARAGADDAFLSIAGDDRPPPAARLMRWIAFLEDEGELDDHCAQIEAATHDVIAKLRDRLATLERRGDATYARARAIRTLASLDDTREGLVMGWGYGTPRWAPGDGEPLVPPMPRRKTRARVEEPRSLEDKRASRDVVRELRSARVTRTAEWLREAGLMDGAVQLSKVRLGALRSTEAPAAWIAVARAQHLGRSAALSELGVQIEPARGVVTVGNEVVGLASPDCIVSAAAAPSHEARRRS